MASAADINGVVNAIRRGDLETVQQYLKTGGDPDAVYGSDGNNKNHRNEFEYKQKYPLLLIAVKEQNIEIVKALLEAGADVNGGDALDYTALFVAINKENLELVNILLDADADVLATAMNDETPLLHASSKNSVNVLKTILDAGAIDDINISINGDTPLHRAAFNGNLQNVKLLIEMGADIDGLPEFSERISPVESPLMMAVEKGHVSVAKYLIEHGADIHQTGKLYVLDKISGDVDQYDDSTLLHFAVIAETNSLLLLEILLDAGVDPNIENELELAPIELALNLGKIDAFKYLKSRGLTARKEKLNRRALSILHISNRENLAALWAPGRAAQKEAKHQKGIKNAGGPEKYYGSKGRRTRKGRVVRKRRLTRKN